MNKKILASIIIFVIVFSVAIIAYSDPSARFFVAKTLGLKQAPESTSDIKVEEFLLGLHRPTSLKFINDDILFLEKNSGQIRLVRDGILKDEPIIDFEVANQYEQGLLGIEKNDSTVFIYLTEAEEDGGERKSNTIYSFVWDGNELSNMKSVAKLPSFGLGHVGGGMAIDEDGTLFAVTGDQRGSLSPIPEGPLQNNHEGEVDDTGIILKIDSGSPLPPSQSHYPIENYYSIGIRNSFGLTFDPITGKLWQSENGPEINDEINLVEPRFNSGWNKTMGPANASQIEGLPTFFDFEYSDPEFTWESTVVPTALIFITDPRWPEEIQQSVLVGTCTGNIYKFQLNEQRTSFVFENSYLDDLILNKEDPADEIVFLSGLGCVTDLELGPDGNLYAVSHAHNGAIYKIIPS